MEPVPGIEWLVPAALGIGLAAATGFRSRNNPRFRLSLTCVMGMKRQSLHAATEHTLGEDE